MARPRTRKTQPGANEVAECARVWLNDVIALSGMQQAVLSRRLSELLNRNVSATAIGNMQAGRRSLLADEMMAVARICRVPLPSAREKKILPQPRLPGLETAERRAS